MVAKAIVKAVTRSAGKKLTKRKSKKELERQLDLERAKRVNKEKRKEIRAKDAAKKKKVQKDRSQTGMVGSGSRSVPKGAKGPKKKEAEPMRAMSDRYTGLDAVTKGQAGKINTGKTTRLDKQLQTPTQKKAVDKYVRLAKKKRDGGELTTDEKRWMKSDARYEAERLRRAGQGAGNKRSDAKSKARTKTKAQRDKALALSLKGEKKTVRTKDDMGDPSTGEVTSKTTANRAAALARSADRQAKIAADQRKDKRTRARNVREMKRKK